MVERRMFLIAMAGGVVPTFGTRARGEKVFYLKTTSNDHHFEPLETKPLVQGEHCSYANEMQSALEADINAGLVSPDCERLHRCPLCKQQLTFKARSRSAWSDTV
jgi:hypothetical protein